MHTEEEINQIDNVVVESPEMLGKECATCFRILAYKFYNRDSSYRDGFRDQCSDCESQPRLSLDEHTARLRERNFSSHAVKAQRREHQDDYKNDDARAGQSMHHAELILRLRKYIPNLWETEGRIEGDLALYLIYPCPQTKLNGADYEYVGYIPSGFMNEFSCWEFQKDKDILVREKNTAPNGLPGRGWRTPLLRLIKKGLITEDQCRQEFGEAVGPASTVWHRTLYLHRNSKKLEVIPQ
jgi:hypothetical protein